MEAVVDGFEGEMILEPTEEVKNATLTKSPKKKKEKVTFRIKR